MRESRAGFTFGESAQGMVRVPLHDGASYTFAWNVANGIWNYRLGLMIDSELVDDTVEAVRPTDLGYAIAPEPTYCDNKNDH